jgi:hypothetical protein
MDRVQNKPNSVVYFVLQALHFPELSVHRILPGGTGVSHNLPNQSFVKRKLYICTQTLTFEQRTGPYAGA